MRCLYWYRVLTGQDNSLQKQDGPWSWVVVTCAFLQAWVAIGMTRSYGVFLPVLMKEFNEGRDQIALIGSLRAGISFLCAVLTSWLANNFGSRLICGIGHISMVVAYTLSSVVHQKYAMFFTFSLFHGIGLSFITVSDVICIVKYFKKHRSLALGMYSSGGAMGIMTLPNIMQYLLDTMGWRNTFRVVAGSFVFFSLLCIVYSPNIETETHDTTEETAGQVRRNRNPTSLRSMIDLSVWKVPKFVFAAISISVATLGLYSPSLHLVKFSEEIGIPAVKSSSLYTFLGISSLIARLGAGKLCDLSCVNASMVNMSAELLAALATFFLTISTEYIHLAVVIFAYGLADGAFRTSTIVLLSSSVVPAKSASAYGQGNTANAPFHVAGPAITGLLADITGTYTVAFYMCSAVLVVAAAVHLVPIFFRLNQISRDFTLEEVHIGAMSEEHENAGDKQPEQTEDENRNQISHSNPGYDGEDIIVVVTEL